MKKWALNESKEEHVVKVADQSGNAEKGTTGRLVVDVPVDRIMVEWEKKKRTWVGKGVVNTDFNPYPYNPIFVSKVGHYNGNLDCPYIG